MPTTYNAAIVGEDPKTDIAILKIDDLNFIFESGIFYSIISLITIIQILSSNIDLYVVVSASRHHHVRQHLATSQVLLRLLS